MLTISTLLHTKSRCNIIQIRKEWKLLEKVSNKLVILAFIINQLAKPNLIYFKQNWIYCRVGNALHKMNLCICTSFIQHQSKCFAFLMLIAIQMIKKTWLLFSKILYPILWLRQIIISKWIKLTQNESS